MKRKPYRPVDWSKVKTEWEDCTMGLICECGKGQIVLDSQSGENTECPECGRLYCLSVKVEVAEATS